MKNWNCNYAIPFSSLHTYVRKDSVEMNKFATPLEAHYENFNQKDGILLPAFIKWDIKKNDYIFIANWSISEFPLKFRRQFISAIKNSKYSIISFQENFEGINNQKFFKGILKNLNNNYIYEIQPLKYYNNAFLNENKHFILTIIKK